MSSESPQTSKRRPFGRRSKAAKAAKAPGRIAQVRQVFKVTRRADPAVVWWMLLVFTGILVVGLGLGYLFDHPIYATVLTLPFALLGAMFVMARRAEGAAYRQIEGHPGAAGAALRVLRRGWTVEEQPVAVDARTQDSVFRAVGRPGVVLVGDGPAHRIGKLLVAEEKKLKRVLPGVPLHLIQAGDDAGQIPLRKVGSHVMKLKPTLTKEEVQVVLKRIKSLGGVRAPIPQGVDPMRARPDRKGMRGR